MSFPPAVTRDLVLERAAELLAADEPHKTTLYIVIHDTVTDLMKPWRVEDPYQRIMGLIDETLEHVADFLGVKTRGAPRGQVFTYKMYDSKDLADLLAQARKHERVTFRQRLAWWFGSK